MASDIPELEGILDTLFDNPFNTSITVGHTVEVSSTGPADPGPSTSQEFGQMTTHDSPNSPKASHEEEFNESRIRGEIEDSGLTTGKKDFKIELNNLDNKSTNVQLNPISGKTEIQHKKCIEMQLDLAGLPGIANMKKTEIKICVVHMIPKYTNKKPISNAKNKPVFDLYEVRNEEVQIKNLEGNPILGRKALYEKGKPLKIKFNTLSSSETNFGNEEEARKWLLVVMAGGYQSELLIQVLSAIRPPKRLKRRRSDANAPEIKTEAQEAVFEVVDQNREEWIVEKLDPTLGVEKTIKIKKLMHLTLKRAKGLSTGQLEEKIFEEEAYLEKKSRQNQQ